MAMAIGGHGPMASSLLKNLHQANTICEFDTSGEFIRGEDVA